VTTRIHGVGEAAEPQIDRRHHFIAARIARIAFEMGLDLRHQAGDRAVR
jgi:hypothetical protein